MKEAKWRDGAEDEEESVREEDEGGEEGSAAGLAMERGGGIPRMFGEGGEAEEEEGEGDEVRRSFRAPPGREGSIFIFFDLISVLLRCFMAFSG